MKGRGSHIQPPNRFESVVRIDDWDQLDPTDELPESGDETVYLADETQSIVSENNSPDLNFRYSINPYRGCAHGCAYCYARPTHEYLGFNAGIDFETKILVKYRAADLLRDWLARDSWVPEMICLSGNTDCYQPAERELQLTRGCLEIAAECNQPMGIITKNALVARDIDILARMAKTDTVRVAVSITSLDQSLTRILEPRTSSPQARLRAVRELSEAGISVHVMVAPIIPGLNDAEIPAILEAAKDAGACGANHILLRLPQTVQEVFLEWLHRCLPTQAEKIEGRIRATRGGDLNRSSFGERMRGEGLHAEQISQTFQLFARKCELDKRIPSMDTTVFRRPRNRNGQQFLF